MTTQAPERPDDDSTIERRYAAFKAGVALLGGDLTNEDEIRSAFERETGEQAPQPQR